MASMVAVPTDGDLRRPVGRRDAMRDPRRPRELAVGASAARMEATRLHGADPRPERRVPCADPWAGLAVVRRRRAALDRRAVRLDHAPLVARWSTPRLRPLAMPLPPDANCPPVRALALQGLA